MKVNGRAVSEFHALKNMGLLLDAMAGQRSGAGAADRAWLYFITFTTPAL